MQKWPVVLLALITLSAAPVAAWGERGHTVVSRVAVRTLPLSVPLFLARQIDWIGSRSVLADTWRRPTEPFAKASEDPNHNWHMERFAFMGPVPRSRQEFVLRVYDEFLRVKGTDPARAAYLNIYYTGTLPFAAVEGYERLKVAFRSWREQRAARQETTFIEQDAAFYLGWMSHYIADGAQPLHTSMHDYGWVGDNPKHYTTDPAVHWTFENTFVDAIALKEADIEGRIPPAPTRIADPFSALLDHLARSHARLERLYALEQQKGFEGGESGEAREFVYACTADAATLLRNLVYTAWVTSADPAPAPGSPDPTNNPNTPRYNPATGSAPAGPQL